MSVLDWLRHPGAIGNPNSWWNKDPLNFLKQDGESRMTTWLRPDGEYAQTGVDKHGNELAAGYTPIQYHNGVITSIGPNQAVVDANALRDQRRAASDAALQEQMAAHAALANSQKQNTSIQYPGFKGTGYQSAVQAALAGIARDQMELESVRKQRLAEIQSRYNLNGPTAEEAKIRDEQVAQVNRDHAAASEAIQRNYGAALNTTKAQAAQAEQVAASTSGDIKKFYDAAGVNVQARNANMAVDGSAGTTGLGLGNTAVGGAAALAPEAIAMDGLRAAASSADDLAVRSNNLAFLRDSVQSEQADQATSVDRARLDAQTAINLATDKAVRDRIAQERSQMFSAMDATNGTFDNQNFSLRGDRRTVGLDGAKYEADARNAWNQDATKFNLGELVAQRDKQEQAAAFGGGPNLTAAVMGFDNKIADDGMGGLYNPVQSASSYAGQIQGVLAGPGTAAEKRQKIASINATVPPTVYTVLSQNPDLAHYLTLQ